MSGKDPFLLPYHAKEEAMEAKKVLAGDSQSDHFVLVQAYNGWATSMKQGLEQEYCNRNFLSSQGMNNIHRIKQQFMDVLLQAGFNIEDPNSWRHAFQTAENPLEQNKYQTNLPLIKGVLTAGLSPNIFRIIDKESMGALKLMTVDNCEITPRQQSVMKGETDMDKVCKLGIFQEKFKTKNVFLDTCSTISPLTLLLFADRPVVFEPPPAFVNRLPKDTIGLVVDGWVSFVAERKVAECIMDLRAAIDALLCESFGETSALNIPKHIADQLVETVSKLLVSELSGEVHEETSLQSHSADNGGRIIEGAYDEGPSYDSILSTNAHRKRPPNRSFNQRTMPSFQYNNNQNKIMRLMPSSHHIQQPQQHMMMQQSIMMRQPMQQQNTFQNFKCSSLQAATMTPHQHQQNFTQRPQYNQQQQYPQQQYQHQQPQPSQQQQPMMGNFQRF
mmetsp:Transcript_37634/g.47447  ORF Transcript_37634/g.47447 Transcript_37634/m.47447 type:complete len:445 (+) Transcript_37634:58-1392(+)